MTNQTIVFSALDIDATSGIANVTSLVNDFVSSGIAANYINFCIQPVVVTTYFSGGSPTVKNWFTVQVNYYNPALYL